MTISTVMAALSEFQRKKIVKGKDIVIDDLAGVVASISTGSSSNIPSNTVTSETYFGLTPSAGVSSNYSRGDHTHGTPTASGSYLPITSFAGLNKITVGTGSPASPNTGDLWIDTN